MIARCKGREHPRGLTFAPRTKGRTRLDFEPVLRLQNYDLAEFRVPAEFFLPWRCIPDWPRTSRSVASTRSSAQPCNASRPKSRISSTSRSSAASASRRSPSRFPTARHYRRHSVTKIRMGLEKGQKRCVAEFCHRHGSIPSIAESSVYSPQCRIAPKPIRFGGVRPRRRLNSSARQGV